MSTPDPAPGQEPAAAAAAAGATAAGTAAGSAGPAGPVLPTAPAASAARPPYGVTATIVAVVFGLFYAYEIWEAVSSLVSLTLAYAELGEASGVSLGMPASVLWPLLAAIVLPALVFAAALLLGRRRGLLAKALLFLTGWAAVNAWSLALGQLLSAAIQG